MKVMISQPMKGRTEQEIIEERNKITEELTNQGHQVVDTMFTEEAPEDCNAGLYYLAKSIEAMSKVDAVVFAPGWEKAGGCIIEHMCANQYEKFIKMI